MVARRSWQTIVAAALVAATVGLSACTPGDGEGADTDQKSSTEHFGYLVDTQLVTTNAGTVVGASSNTEALSGRLYPAVFVPGPSGQMIPNSDMVQTQVLPGVHRKVIYTLSDNAQYSDGTQMTCTDFLLYVVAGQNPDLFGSHLPLTKQVSNIECEPGVKRFTVEFGDDGGGRWRHLFGPGSVMPAHAIARKAGMSVNDLHGALRNRDVAALQEPARIWRDGFSLQEFDPELQVSSGPFVVERVGADGEAILGVNPHYYGDSPRQDSLVVWPHTADPAQLAEVGALRIADIRSENPTWVNRDDPTNKFIIEAQAGDLTDTLMLGELGIFQQRTSRAAFAACVDQAAVAGASSEVSGIEVPPVLLRTVMHHDPVTAQMQDITDRQAGVDIPKASVLAGYTIRIGYPGPDERKAAMVQAIARSCEPAGITVVDASAEGSTMADMPRRETSEWGGQFITEGTVDAVLSAVDPLAEYGTVSARAPEIDGLRAAEDYLWEEVPTIPLSAQPRRFVIDRTVGNVVVYTGLAGIGWNMDRWHVSEDGNAR
ncbi:peptide ABC transporter [Corynebacterium testudinoris]|uniref:Extracellular solute-binding protein, family 5 n=1 Tax=Corynebacterium testudinoris TaxID=136857 RepID=A0A0G3H833_9CORY|nr:extracellular solute-binding protein, family 5 [Corynebacterium testudinoris]MBX8994975.1 peptide ABC transporter [Corynebacterium testudinoris]